MKALSKKEQLLSAFAASTKVGGGVLTLAEIAFYLNTQNNIALRKLLTDCVKKGMVRRLAAGIYESTLTPPDPMTAIYKVANKIRRGVLKLYKFREPTKP